MAYLDFSSVFPSFSHPAGFDAPAAPAAPAQRISRRALAARALRDHAAALPPAAPRAFTRRRSAQLSREAAAALWTEFSVIYIAMPLMLAFALEPTAMWPMLIGSLLFALLILHRMPGFTWKRRLFAPRPEDWGRVAIIGLGAAVLALPPILAFWPERLLAMPLEAPKTWALVLLVYPTVSVLPQEVIWRILFFERYGALFPNQAVAALANAGVFALAHLFYGNWPAVVFAGLGGFFFSIGYLKAGRRRALVTVCAMHALAGLALFSLGLHEHFSNGMVR
ncbi:CPBP family intramembrane glutamic endopeptidase [Rhodovulum sp. DZ06]|uniref:CPBP family intramembrane glutamic endopeptidase n=1 Tax=Rhodovulum sp. DZ06 TaxID=3425126 RepID=UPI003D3523B7